MVERFSRTAPKRASQYFGGSAAVMFSSLATGMIIFVFIFSMRVETLIERDGTLPNHWSGTIFSMFHVALYDADMRSMEQGASAEDFALGRVASDHAYLQSVAAAIFFSLCITGIYYVVRRVVAASAFSHAVIASLVLATAGWASLDRRWSTGAAQSMENAYVSGIVALLAVGVIRIAFAKISIASPAELYCVLLDFRHTMYLALIGLVVGFGGVVAVAPVFGTEIRQWEWELRTGIKAWCCVRTLGRWANPQPMLFVKANTWYHFSTIRSHIWFTIAEAHGDASKSPLLVSNWVVCTPKGDVVECASHRVWEDFPSPVSVSDVCPSDYGTTLVPYFVITDVRPSFRPSGQVATLDCRGLPDLEIASRAEVPSNIADWYTTAPVGSPP